MFLRYFKALGVFLLFILSGNVLQAQDEKLFQAKNSLFVELGGTGIIYSINYDRIFLQKRNTFLSYRLGISTIPVNPLRPALISEVNLLTGRSNHHAEFGIGTLFYAYTPDAFQMSESPYRHINTVLLARIGYRYQKPKGGLFFRAAFVPGVVLNRVQYINPWSTNAIGNMPIIWAGVGIGKSFR